jgi:putative zinc finger/helix-turn-helix YgiT family protein
MRIEKCPAGHSQVELIEVRRQVDFKGETLTISAPSYKCRECGIEFATIEQTAAAQKLIAEAYREKVDLLTGREIRDGRKKLGLTQAELANRINVGIASVKRWEGVQIQTKAMDNALRQAFCKLEIGNPYTGNRDFSPSRTKLVLMKFQEILKKPFLVLGDKLLFDAKYAFYADMLAFNMTGQSMTGAAYAALPHGPQLNNYAELVDLIRDSDENEVEPLSEVEIRIIQRVASTFPDKRAVYDASHEELVWKEKPDGRLIPYTDAIRLTQI